MSGGILYHSFLVSMSSRRINNVLKVLNYIVRLLTAVSDFDFRFEGRGSWWLNTGGTLMVFIIICALIYYIIYLCKSVK